MFPTKYISKPHEISKYDYFWNGQGYIMRDGRDFARLFRQTTHTNKSRFLNKLDKGLKLKPAVLSVEQQHSNFPELVKLDPASSLKKFNKTVMKMDKEFSHDLSLLREESVTLPKRRVRTARGTPRPPTDLGEDGSN